MLLGEGGVPALKLRWIVWTKGNAPSAQRSGKCACTIAASRGTYGASVAASASLRGGTATTAASGTRDPGGASSVTRWPSAASPRTSATTTRCGPPEPFAGRGGGEATT